MTQLDLLALLTDADTGDVVVTPAEVHRLYEPGWRKNPDPAAWEIDPDTRRHYPVSEDHPFHLLYHVACSTCPWTSGDYDNENAALEAGLDHAWPGWRSLPVTTERPNTADDGPLRRWHAQVTAAYPPGWVAAGGPVRTSRPMYATRHHWEAHFGYWDIGVPVEGGKRR